VLKAEHKHNVTIAELWSLPTKQNYPKRLVLVRGLTCTIGDTSHQRGTIQSQRSKMRKCKNKSQHEIMSFKTAVNPPEMRQSGRGSKIHYFRMMMFKYIIIP